MASATYEVTALALALLPESDRRRSKDFASYSVEWLPLAASAGRAKASVTIDAQHDFIGLLLTGNSTDTATPPVENATPQFTINFEFADRKVFDKEVHWRNIIGSASTPFPLPFPWWLSRASTLTGLLSNLTATANNARVTVHGFILHDYGRTSSRGY